MSTETIEDLRRHLFAAIAGVKDGTVTIDKAKTIADLCQVVVNTAKVEVDYLRVTEGGESKFINTATAHRSPPALPLSGGTPGNGIAGITRHICKDD